MKKEKKERKQGYFEEREEREYIYKRSFRKRRFETERRLFREKKSLGMRCRFERYRDLYPFEG